MAAADSHDTEGLKAALVASEARAAAAEAQNAALTLMLEKLRRALYGRRSERKERLLDQLELALDELTASATEDELAAERAAAGSTEVKGFVRRDEQDETGASIRMRREAVAWNGGRA